jgi:hypothetical protein
MCPKPVGTCRDPKHTEGYQEYTWNKISSKGYIIWYIR